MSDYFIRDIEALYFAKSMISKMRELSLPLFNHTSITNFSYLKFNRDGSILNLTTEEKWIQFRFEEKIKYKILFKEHLSTAKYGNPYTYLWPKNTEDTLLGALHHYNIWNGCNIYIPNTSHIEVFSFASSVENENINNFYINNLPMLQAFIICFKEQIIEIPGINEKCNQISTELTIPPHELSDINTSTTTINNIYHTNKIKRIHFTQDFYLTTKELECCSYLIKGYDIKRIAKITNLSPRTVETHINKTKLRMNISTKNELMDYLSNNRWIFDALIHNN